MTITQFRRLIDMFGAERTRWPEDQRGAAETLSAGSADARAALDRAAMLAARERARPGELPAFGRGEVANAALDRADAATSRHSARAWPRVWRAFIPPAALVLLALIGCLLGLRAPLPSPGTSEPLVAELSVLLTGDADEPL